jgi:hypothetical protein
LKFLRAPNGRIAVVAVLELDEEILREMLGHLNVLWANAKLRAESIPHTHSGEADMRPVLAYPCHHRGGGQPRQLSIHVAGGG